MTAFGGALTDPTKIMGARIGAYVIDFLLATVVTVGVFFVFGLSEFEQIHAGSDVRAQEICDDVTGPTSSGNGGCFALGDTAYVGTASDMAGLRNQSYLAWFGIGFLNYVLLSSVTGGTIGKLIFGLRVTTARGQRAGLGRNTARWLLLIIDQACCFLPGLLTSFNSKGHRRIGDMAAGTYVVHRSAEGRLLHIPGHLHVKNRDPNAIPGAAPARPATGAVVGGGVDEPVFDAARNTYVRYDQVSGTWFQWDDRTQTWIPAQ